MIRLSYVVVTDGWEPVAELAAALAAQTTVDEIELVLVCVGDGEVSVPALDLRARTVRAAGGRDARAAGIAAAEGDLVALGETHVVPSPDWAREVVDAHDRGADVVLPRMRNANPESALSWAAFLMDYGRYARAATATTAVPAYNATVRRALLLELPRLDEALRPGVALDAALRARGASVAQLTRATLAHVNVDQPVDWARERALGGLLLARARRAGFGAARRLGYALAWPLIAALLFGRALRAPRATAPSATVGALALGCGVSALAEAVGYVGPRGAGRAERRMLDYEMHKRRYVRSRG
jgi:hypothetical protein